LEQGLRAIRARGWALLSIAVTLSVLVYLVVRISFGLWFANQAVLAQASLLKTNHLTVSKLISLADQAQNSAKASQSWLADPLVGSVNVIPGLGDTLVAVGAGTRVVTDLSSSLSLVFAGDSKQEQTRIGRLRVIDLLPEDLKPARVLVAANLAQAALEKFALESKALDSRYLLFGLGAKFDRAKTQAANAQELLEVAVPMAVSALVVLHSGDEQPAAWFVANQNLAEARGTGGIVGSFAVVEVNRGKLRLLDTGSDQDLNARATLTADPGFPNSTNWLLDPKVWQDVNANLNTRRVAERIVGAWNANSNTKVSGVLMLGQGVAQDLVAAVQGVSAAGPDGKPIELTETNTAYFLAKGIYARYPNVTQKNAAVLSVLRTLMEKLQSTKPNAGALIATLRKRAGGDKLVAWSSDPLNQEILVQAGSGGFDPSVKSEAFSVSVNNEAGSKLEAYLHLSAQIAECQDGPGSQSGRVSQRAKGSKLELAVTNSAPKTGLPAYTRNRLDLVRGTQFTPGSNREFITVYLPTGSQLTGFFVNGKSVSASSFTDGTRDALIFDLTLQPGQTQVIRIAVDFASERETKPWVDFSPLFNRPTTSVASGSAKTKLCGAR
jgi:hypothetical protein